MKTTPRTDVDDLRFHPAEEARRLCWLASQGIPVPEVVEVGGNDEVEWLVTTAVAGRPAASAWDELEHSRVLESVADLARCLHRLDVDACPFDARLGTTLRWAERAAANGWVDLDDLDHAHRGWSSQALLEKLRATPAPSEDLVVCHGDLCLDNVLIDPQTLRVAAIIDAGRLGVADRWRDLSLLIRSIHELAADPAADQATDRSAGDERVHALLGRYGVPLCEPKVAFYQLLDEFF